MIFRLLLFSDGASSGDRYFAAPYADPQFAQQNLYIAQIPRLLKNI